MSRSDKKYIISGSRTTGPGILLKKVDAKPILARVKFVDACDAYSTAKLG